tara:strand:+ start:267 stop:524 length:258 start_codon:yes stop_codon:yes gene_type:complete
MFNLDDYINPKQGEEASHKGIPMEYRYHPDVLKAKGKGRIRYRGPRYDSMRMNTLMEDAKCFSIYPNSINKHADYWKEHKRKMGL